MESEQRYLIKILVCAGSECAEDRGTDTLAVPEIAIRENRAFERRPSTGSLNPIKRGQERLKRERHSANLPPLGKPEKGVVELIHIATDQQAANGFTKPLPKAKFERWVVLLNLQ
jgi:hypothetical protein